MRKREGKTLLREKQERRCPQPPEQLLRPLHSIYDPPFGAHVYRQARGVFREGGVQKWATDK